VSLIDRNLIKFNLTSRTKSLQPPGVFSFPRDVVALYTTEPDGKDHATHLCTDSDV